MEKVNKRKNRRRNKNQFKNLVILIFVCLVLGGIYYYLRIHTADPINNTDTSKTQASYTLLENTNPVLYKEIIMYDRNTNISSIAQTFYNNSKLWPYIFIANKTEAAIINNPLDIPSGTVIRIPTVPDKYLDLTDTFALNKINHLTDSILSLK